MAEEQGARLFEPVIVDALPTEPPAPIDLRLPRVGRPEAQADPHGRQRLVGDEVGGDVHPARLERVTYNDTFDSFPMFSPDGRRLVFASNRNDAKPGETNVFIADWK